MKIKSIAVLCLGLAMITRVPGEPPPPRETSFTVPIAFETVFDVHSGNGKDGRVTKIWNGKRKRCLRLSDEILTSSKFIRILAENGYTGFFHFELEPKNLGKPGKSSYVLGTSYTCWIRNGIIEDFVVPELPDIRGPISVERLARALGLNLKTAPDMPNAQHGSIKQESK
jgi:hypothetical protein